ncbi:hypothetical protein CEE69_08225 [Rhodopirellula bahusiensis]|uniref:Uncharacterized protein n=1 Tax=Rhodopirellula bahusiensis TaxID=2014065 RepID=A0A2G1W979_9BACT|nr:hypothetical protein CEE69_08225 [Rhodopirellula bahusiensis]
MMMPSKSGTESGQIEKPRGALTWLLRRRHACPSIAGTHSGVNLVAAPRGDFFRRVSALSCLHPF